MGETPQNHYPQQVEITLAPGAGEAVAAFIRDLMERYARVLAVPPAAPEPAQTPYDLGLVPWAFHSPSHGGDVVAYVDDRNQVRHVPGTRTSEVPKNWMRVWLEDRR